MKPFFRRSGLLSLLGITALTAVKAQAAATILLWPIDPWLSADARATELWIQNQGNSATTMQIRIVRWKQEGGYERYTAQQDVVASPPIVTIAKGSKQLIRLIKQGTIPSGVEQAYRIIVDEIPQPDAKAEPSMGLKLQMRYSIPLFVYGQGSPPSTKESITRWRTLSSSTGGSFRRRGNPRLRSAIRGRFTSGSAGLRLSRAGKNARLPRGCWVMCCRAAPEAGRFRQGFISRIG